MFTNPTIGLQGVNNNNINFITPADAPAVTNTTATNNTTLKNQLAALLGKLFQDLFPIDADYQYAAEYISDSATLLNNQSTILNDIEQIKAAVLTINQLAPTAADRIPVGYTIGDANAGSVSIAGLTTADNQNTVLVSINNIYEDVITESWTAAQADYAALRDQITPLF